MDRERKDHHTVATRTVVNTSEDHSFLHNHKSSHYYIASKQYYQHVDMTPSNDLPRKKVRDPWSSLDSIVHIDNNETQKR